MLVVQTKLKQKFPSQKEDENIQMIKPANDKSKYREVILQNKMKVLLIESSDEQSGARIRIKAGSNQELFNKFNGLAHLLEHILYNGDPSGDQKVSDLLQKSQGNTNAVTNDKSTDFYFTCSKNFEKLLKIWSTGFNKATIKESDIKREIAAVNSEFINAQSEDQWHYQEQVRKSSNPKNPFYRFNMGSHRTLPLNETSEILKETIKYYQKYYTADKMTLILVSNKNLDQLQEIAESNFGWYKPSKDGPIKYDYQSFHQDLLGKIVYINSRKKQNLLTLIFPIPKNLKVDSQKSSLKQYVHFIRKLIEMPDSTGFIYQLQQNKYSGGSLWQEPFDFDLLQVKLLLSGKGLNNVAQIINHFFKYINQITESLENQDFLNYHKQLSFLSYIQFYYNENISTKEYIQKFNNWSGVEKKENIVIESLNVFYDFNKDIYSLLLEQLTPENCLIFLQSHTFKAKKKQQQLRFYQKKVIKNLGIDLGDMHSIIQQDDFFKLDFIKISSEKTDIQQLKSIKQYVKNQHSQDDFQDEELLNKKLQFYNPEMNYYFNEISIPNKLMQNLKKARHNYMESQITFQPLKYLTQDLNIVSNCRIQQIKEYQYDRKKQSIQDNIIMPTQLTDQINTMIEQRSQLRYDEDCLNNEMKSDKQMKKIINDQFQTVTMMTLRQKMIPLTTVKISFQSPNNFVTQQDYIKYRILMLMIQNQILDEQKKIQLSGNQIEIGDLQKQLTIQINGFSDQIEKIITFILNKMTSTTLINEQAFTTAKLYLEVEFSQSKSLGKQIKHIYNNILNVEYSSSQQKIEILDKILIGDLQLFHKKYMSNLFIKQYFAGNIMEKQSLKLSDLIKKTMKIAVPVKQETLFREKMIKVIPEQNIIYREFNQIEDDKNNGILNYYQIDSGNPEKEKAIILFLDRLISAQSFKFLREQNNLGYIASAQANEKHGVLGITIYVQGSEKDPIQMDYYIEQFIQEFYQFLQKISDQEFEFMQQRFKQDNQQHNINKHFIDVIDQLEQDIDIENDERQIIDQQWNKLLKLDYIQRNNNLTLKILKKLKKNDLLEFWKNSMLTNQRKISIQLFSKKQFSDLPQKFDNLSSQKQKLYIGKFNVEEQQSY